MKMRCLLFVVLVLLLAPALAAGQDAGEPASGAGRSYDPPVLEQDEITLLEALRLTLGNDARIALVEHDVAFQEGRVVEESGAFDTTITGEVFYEHINEELRASRKEAERKRRAEIQEVADELGFAATDAESTLAELQALQADPTGARLSDEDVQTQIDLFNLLIGDADTPAQAAELEALRDGLIDDATATYSGLATQFRTQEQDTLQRLANLGEVPEEDESYLGRFRIEALQRYRNGISWGPFYEWSIEGSNFKGKRKDADFGGKGLKDLFKSTLGFTVTVPLARGKGVEAAGAPERAAEITADATRASLKHQAAVSVFETSLAYWELRAAQERLAVAGRSSDLQDELVEIADSLIEADEMAAAEKSRVLARQANVRALLEDAKREVYRARVNLARVIGLQVRGESTAPLAAADLPSPPDEDLPPDVPPGLLRDAVENRQDYQTATLLAQSGAVLLRAAEIAKKPKLDLTTEVFYTALEEGSADGSFGGPWVGPSGRVRLDAELPIGNQTRRGRHAQSQAVHNQQTITAGDLARTIRADVVESWLALGEAILQVRLAAQAVASYEETLDAEMERFRRGLSTLIDTILTEQRLTDAELELAFARQAYAQLLAELRFASGTLVAANDAGGEVREEDLTTAPGLD